MNEWCLLLDAAVCDLLVKNYGVLSISVLFLPVLEPLLEFGGRPFDPLGP